MQNMCTRHVYICLGQMYLLLLNICQYVCIFLSQIKVAGAANRSARRCYVWYEYEMTLKYSADLGSIQHCVSILPCYLPFPRRCVYHGNLSASRLGVCAWRHSVFPCRDSQGRDVHRFIQTAWLHLVPCLVYFTTVNNGFILNSSALSYPCTPRPTPPCFL